MKFANISKGLLLGLSLLLATSVFAGNVRSTKGSLQLDNAVTVGGTSVPAGSYSVKWEGTGNVQMSIMRGSKVVATAPARVIDLEQSSDNNAAVLRSNGDGSKALSEIHFSGKKYALAVGNESASNEMNGSSQ